MKKLLKLKLVLIGAIPAVIFSGCFSTIKLENFKHKTMQKSTYTPTKETLATENKKVAIIKINDGEANLAKRLNLGKITSQQLKSILSEIGKQSTIVNTAKSNINKEEFQYIISGKINDTTYEYKYLAPAPTLLITGKTIMAPAKHQYKACTNGIIEIENLSSFQVEKSIPFEKCKIDVECAKKSVRRDNSTLIKESARDAIKSISVDLKNFFAHKGYILEQRINNDKKIIVKTTLGINSGAKKGADVDFYTMNKSENTLIGKGKISNQITNNSSWIIVKSLNNGVELKSGDFAKIRYEKGFYDSYIR